MTEFRSKRRTNNGDGVAVLFEDLTLREVKVIAARFLGRPEVWTDYNHLKEGSARAGIMNRVRGHVNKIDRGIEQARKKHEKAEKKKQEQHNVALAKYLKQLNAAPGTHSVRPFVSDEPPGMSVLAAHFKEEQ